MELEKKYMTGIDWQDFQHKQLIEMFGKVKEARRNNKDANAYRYAVAFLVMYVNSHFSLEQAYMEKYKYPDLEFHSKEHGIYEKNLEEFRKSHHEYTEEALAELVGKIYDWILNHILENDKKLGAYLLKYENH